MRKQPASGISYGILNVTDSSIINFYLLADSANGYIDRPVDWLQYALKIKAYTNFFDKVMVIWKLGVRSSKKCNGYWIRQKSYSLGIC